VRNSTIGPNVSVLRGAVITDSELRDSLIGARTKISRSSLRNSLVGDEVVLDGVRGEITVGDHSEVRQTN
jgi:glucose-1-phosphate thymidylyltransferase